MPGHVVADVSQPQPSSFAATGGSPQVSNEFPQPSASDSDDELLRLARKLVAHSPQQALAWAQAQNDSRLRTRMMVAVLQAWGEDFPAAAVSWARTQPEDSREQLAEAALTGALRMQPADALEIAHQLLVEDPDFGGACVGSLVSKFSASRDFSLASQLAAAAPDDFRADWTRAVFRAWAQSQPQDALQAMDSIQDEKLRETVFSSVVNGWADGTPSSLAAYAETLPPGADRELALKKALDNWSLQDPAALATWLNTLPAGSDFDAGAALMLAKTDDANLTPQTAMQWVESISNPKLKLDSFAHVLVQWNQTDPAASQHYVSTVKWLSDRQRGEILKVLASAR